MWAGCHPGFARRPIVFEFSLIIQRREPPARVGSGKPDVRGGGLCVSKCGCTLTAPSLGRNNARDVAATPKGVGIFPRPMHMHMCARAQACPVNVVRRRLWWGRRVTQHLPAGLRPKTSMVLVQQVFREPLRTKSRVVCARQNRQA